MSIFSLFCEMKLLESRIEHSQQQCKDFEQRYGITTNDTSDSMASDCDTDGIRPAEIGAEAVHEGGTQPTNRELATEER